MKILIVEDEQKTGDYLKQGLSEAGFVTELACNGVDGLHLALTGDFDLLVLDVMLPGLNGWQVMERVRQSGKNLPVLFLTARDQVEDRVKGLELGADDYLCKPFALIEVAARLEALVRRASGQATSELRHGQVTLNPGALVATFAGEPLSLKPKEFALLELLMRNKGRVLPRKHIEEKLYNWDENVSSNAVEVHVHHLRRKLGSDFIRTVHGIGYTLGDA